MPSHAWSSPNVQKKKKKKKKKKKGLIAKKGEHRPCIPGPWLHLSPAPGLHLTPRCPVGASEGAVSI